MGIAEDAFNDMSENQQEAMIEAVVSTAMEQMIEDKLDEEGYTEEHVAGLIKSNSISKLIESESLAKGFDFEFGDDENYMRERIKSYIDEEWDGQDKIFDGLKP